MELSDCQDRQRLDHVRFLGCVKDFGHYPKSTGNSLKGLSKQYSISGHVENDLEGDKRGGTRETKEEVTTKAKAMVHTSRVLLVDRERTH